MNENQHKKKRFRTICLVLGSIVLGFVVFTLYLFPVLINRKEDFSVPKELVVGDSPSGYSIVNDTVYWENNWGNLSITPAIANNIVTQEQFASFRWKKPDTDIDVAFRFDDAINNGNIWLWQNISHNVTVDDYGWITSNYTLYNMHDVEVINESQAKEFGLLFGDIPSVFYRRGNATTYDEENGWEYFTNISIGFDTFYWLDPEQVNATFNYTYWGKTGYHYEDQYWFDWNSQKDKFQYTLFQNKHYYYVTDIPIKQDKTYYLKWRYSIPLHSSGKFDFLGKLSSYTIQEALESGHYIMIDPWWNSNWNHYKMITIDSSFIDTDLTYFPVLVNSTNTTLIGKCDGGDSVRFIAGSNSGGTENVTEFPYEIEEWTTGGFSIWVNVSKVNSGVNTEFHMYYNNSGASDNQNINGVWNSNYIMVWHMNDSSGYITDSTSNNYDSKTNGSGITYGQSDRIAKYVSVDGTNNGYIEPKDELMEVNYDEEIRGTISLWVEEDDVSQKEIIYQKDQSRDLDIVTNSNSTIAVCKYLGGSYVIKHSTTTTANNAWYFVSVVYDRYEEDLFLYVNDTLESYQDKSNTYAAGGVDSDSAFGYPLGGAGAQDPDGVGAITTGIAGSFDEVRVSKVKLNASWVKADFHTSNQSSGFLSWGEETSQVGTTLQHLLDGWMTGGNASNLSQLVSGWMTGGNASNLSQLVSGWMTGGNVTTISINISDEYPGNGSINAPVQPTVYVTINSSTGETMNITWYYGFTEGNENILLGTDLNITNSTQTELYYNATDRVTAYYWRVMANDSVNWVNETFSFTTEGYPIAPRPPSLGLAIVGIIFGTLGLVSMLMFTKRRKKKKKRYENMYIIEEVEEDEWL